MSTLTVAIIQHHLVWQDSEANRVALAAQIAQAMPADLVVLPEMFNSGFSMAPTLFAESMDGPTLQWLRQQAAHHQSAICGSLAIRLDPVVDGRAGIANRLVFVTPAGDIEYYDKHHLFRMAQEHQHYVAGQQRKIVHYRGMRFLLQVCYDLRFPVFARNRGDYDAMIYVANWPATRSRIWSTLLAARAIENQAFVLACNRVGKDGHDQEYSGDSALLDFTGSALAQGPAHQPCLVKAVLDLSTLQHFRQQFPVALDADDFEFI